MNYLSKGVRAITFKPGDVVHLKRGSIVGVNEGRPGDTVMAGAELVEEHIRLETPEQVKLYNEAKLDLRSSARLECFASPDPCPPKSLGCSKSDCKLSSCECVS
jgi:hypothetical protein